MSAVLKGLFVSFALSLPAAGLAQDAPADRARAALETLRAASETLDAAGSSRDRVRALTATIGAYEEGLSALRSGLRQASLRQAALTAQLREHDGEIAELLLALQRVGGTASPVFLLHPAGPAGTVRAGMLLAQITPAMNAEVADVRAALAELEQLQALQRDATEQLEAGLREVQAARAALNKAIAERSALPKRFVADPVREAILLSSAETLDTFAAELDQLSPNAIAPPPPDDSLAEGRLPLPVRGRLLRAADERDAAGITRRGMIVATEPQAIVSSPVAGTLRYVGPLLNFGEVVILEPQADVLFVFAGLGTVYAETGDIVEKDTPLGLMGAQDGKTSNDFSTDGDETGATRSETLYIEVRKNNTPEDPSLWFRTDKDG
ncbi:MAG: peptidoglycan DD-metalloendopeptidase family protein [Roseobacter sp.]|jgi:septal ring factor EnvC (AmiA/AmiB activator)|nr:peptidoglycan DD-metalloendopeptidase family protein [Roseobacter sp.]